MISATQHFQTAWKYLSLTSSSKFQLRLKLPVGKGPQINCLTDSSPPRSLAVHCPRQLIHFFASISEPRFIVRYSNGFPSCTHNHLSCLLVSLFIAILCIIRQPPSSQQATFCRHHHHLRRWHFRLGIFLAVQLWHKTLLRWHMVQQNTQGQRCVGCQPCYADLRSFFCNTRLDQWIQPRLVRNHRPASLDGKHQHHRQFIARGNWWRSHT